MKKFDWNFIRNLINQNKLLSFLFFIFLSLLSMVPAAIVNTFNPNDYFLHPLIIGGFFSFILLWIAFFIYYPFFEFRYHFSYLEKQYGQEEFAKFLAKINRKANALLNLNQGILAIQLFKVERYTSDKTIEYNFHKSFEITHSKSKISTMKPKKIRLPIDFLFWFRSNFVPKTPKWQIRANYLGLSSILQEMLFDFLHQYFEKQYLENVESKEDINIENQNSYIVNQMQGLNFNISGNVTYKSLHYLVLFSQLKPLHIDAAESYPLSEEKIREAVFFQEYKSIKKVKSNRRYYNFYFTLNSPNIGTEEYVLLLVADKRLIPDEFLASSIFATMIE